MKKILVFAFALMLVFGFGRSAMAACTDISIGADLVVYGMHVDNKDFDDNTGDALGMWTEKIKIYLFNTYTDKVKTVIRIDGSTHDSSKPSLSVDRAYIEMQEFLNEAVTLKVGKLAWTWQLRKTFGSGAYYHIANGDMEGAFLFKAKPLGWDVTYKFDSDITIALGWGKITEMSVAGNNDNDIDVFFVRYDHMLGESNKFFVALVFYVDRYEPTVGTHTMLGDVWYLNFGIDYFVMDENLELYFEFAYQGGDAHNSSMDFGAMAFNMGAEYTFLDVDTIPYIGMDITYFQGLDGTTYGYQRYNTNWNRTLIAESDNFGGVWTVPGYIGIKLMAGMKSINNDKFGVDFILGFFKADGDLPSGVEKGLGFEIDIVAAYYYSEDVTFSAGLGYFDADEDLGGSDPDAVIMLIWGVNITF